MNQSVRLLDYYYWINFTTNFSEFWQPKHSILLLITILGKVEIVDTGHIGQSEQKQGIYYVSLASLWLQ